MHALTTGEFSFLTDLLHLKISSCGIKTITPGSFNDLSLLISLDISDNWLSYLEAQTFEQLALLQVSVSGKDITLVGALRNG